MNQNSLKPNFFEHYDLNTETMELNTEQYNKIVSNERFQKYKQKVYDKHYPELPTFVDASAFTTFFEKNLVDFVVNSFPVYREIYMVLPRNDEDEDEDNDEKDEDDLLDDYDDTDNSWKCRTSLENILFPCISSQVYTDSDKMNEMKEIEQEILDKHSILVKNIALVLFDTLTTEEDRKKEEEAEAEIEEMYEELHDACYYGDLETVKKILASRQAPLLVKYNNYEIFGTVCSIGNAKLLSYLLSLEGDLAIDVRKWVRRNCKYSVET